MTLRLEPRHNAVTNDRSFAGAVVPNSNRIPVRPIDSLTGIRGVAAIWVFLTHFQPVLARYLGDASLNDNTFLYNGFRGVDLFFILSGFILMYVHEDDFRTIDREKLKTFYVMRFFRVYPLNTIVLVSLIPIVITLPNLVDWFRYDDGVPIPYHSHDFSVAGLVQSILLAQAWTVMKLGEWNGPAWSLSAEVFGYAFFPILAFVIARRTSVFLCAASATASLAILAVLLVIGHHTQDSPTGTFGLIRMIFGFFSGMCLARCARLWPEGQEKSSLLTYAAAVIIIATLSFPRTNMLIMFGFAIMIFGLSYETGLINQVLSSKLMVFLGKISFALYMVHYVPLKMSLWLLPESAVADVGLQSRIVCLVGIVALCFGLAVIVHHHVELRFQRYARLVLRQPGKRPAAALHV